jgi:hypothetical protein
LPLPVVNLVIACSSYFKCSFDSHQLNVKFLR